MKLKKEKQSDKAFIKLFWSYVVVILIPIIFIGITTVGLLFTRLSSESKKLNMQILEQFQNIIDTNFRSVMTIFYQIQESVHVKDFFASNYTDVGEEVYQTWLVSNDIRLYHANNAILENVSVYFANHDFVVDRWARYTLEEYYKKFLSESAYSCENWIQQIKGKNMRFFIPAITENERGKINTLLYCQTLSNSIEDNSMIIAVINVDKLFSHLELAGINADWSFVATDKNDTVVLQTSNFEKDYEKSSLREKGIVIHKRSDVIDLQYTYSFPQGGLSGTIVFINLVFIGLILFAVLFSILAAIILNKTARINVKRLYLPFLKLSDENNMLLKDLDKQVELMRDQVLLNLLNGIELENIKGEDLSGKYHFKFANDTMCVMIAGILDVTEEDARLDIDEADDFWESIQMDIMSHLQEARIEFETVYVNHSRFVFILKTNEGKQLQESLNRLIQYFKSNFNIVMNIGVGNEVDSLCRLNQSYSGAGLALRFAFSYQEDNVVYYHDIKQKESMKAYYTNEKELSLIRHIKLGSMTNVEGILNEIYRINFREMHLSNEALKWLTQQIALTIYKLLSETNIGDGQRLEKYSRVMRNLSRNENPEDCFEILREICYSICKNAGKNSENDAFKEEVLRYLNENYYNSLLSLDSLAEHMNVSYYSLSRWFKDSMGDTFVNYLTEIRLNRAKELLLNTDLAVKQICEKSGFNDSSSFIRVFKKFYSVTPTQFRKERGSGAKR